MLREVDAAAHAEAVQTEARSRIAAGVGRPELLGGERGGGENGEAGEEW